MAQRISVRPAGPKGDLPPILSWKKVKAGTELEGQYTGMREGKFGPLADFVTTAGEAVTLGVPTALLSQLSRIRKGATINIVYNGKQENPKTGRSYHDFDVQAEPTDILSEEGAASEKTWAKSSPGDQLIRQPDPVGEAPAKKPTAAKGRTLKSVFEGLS